jgi:hypothetical protein
LGKSNAKEIIGNNLVRATRPSAIAEGLFHLVAMRACSQKPREADAKALGKSNAKEIIGNNLVRATRPSAIAEGLFHLVAMRAWPQKRTNEKTVQTRSGCKGLG